MKNRRFKEATTLFDEIRNPSKVNYVLLFNACAQLETKEALDLVKRVSSEMPRAYYSDAYIATSLIDALMKCGDVEGAELVFDKSTTRETPVYGAMMKGKR